MNSDTKEVLERIMREKAKITKMITAEVAEKVKDMSAEKPQESAKTKSKSKSLHIQLSSIVASVLLMIGSIFSDSSSDILV